MVLLVTNVAKRGRRRKNRRGRKQQVVVVKSPRRRVGRKRGRRARPTAISALVGPEQKYIASMLNPFEISSCVPDGSTGTGCFSVRQFGTLSTGIAGTVGGIWVNLAPHALYFLDNNNTTGNTVVAGNWLQAANNAQIINQYKCVRPVSGALKVEFVGNTQTDSGSLYMCQFGEQYALAAQTGVTPAVNAATAQYFKRYPLRNGGIIRWCPQNISDTEGWFTTQAGVVPVANPLPGPFIGCIFEGAAPGSAGPAAALGWEFIVNFEGQYVSQGYMPGGINMLEQAHAVPGWFEKAKNVMNSVDAIFPFVSSMADTASRASSFVTRNAPTFRAASNAAGYPMLGQLLGSYPNYNPGGFDNLPIDY